MTELTVLACQINIPSTVTLESKRQHLQKSVDKAHQWLTENPADILVLPELSTLDYSNQTFANLHTLAEPDEGDSYQAWRTVARTHQCWVLFGFARQHRNLSSTSYSIATGIISPCGELKGIYEKLHLAQFGASEEKDYFTVSGKQLVVFECKGFRLAPIICYDIRFAELCRTLTLQHKVDCILHTGAYARDPSFESWHAFAKTRAMENQVYLLSLNRAGDNFGQSVFMPPWVDAQHPATTFADTAEQYKLLTLTKDVIAHARRDYHFVDDRLGNYQLETVNIS